MGYWDTHPMAGDLPMDAEYALTDLLFSNEERDAALHHDSTFYKERLTQKAEEASHIDFFEGQNYVLPFKVAELGIRISDKALSEKIKSMIGDGGASDRGYPLADSSATNNYNEFVSPYDYACALYDQWDKGMDGEVDLSTIGMSIGLFDKINEHTGSGLINKK